MISDLAAEWFEGRGIKVVLPAKEQHCGLVERHNQILRAQLHLLKDQPNAEGIAVPFSVVLSESVPRLMRRCLDVFLHSFQLLVKKPVKP